MAIKPKHGGGLLIPFEPGKSGNPKGSSRKRRARAFLRDALHEGLAGKITPEMAAILAKELSKRFKGNVKEIAAQIEGLTAAQLIATDVILKAASGDPQARRDIIALEPKQIEVETTETAKPKSAEFVPSEADEAALLEQASEDGTLH